jgi:hypothetical protein
MKMATKAADQNSIFTVNRLSSGEVLTDKQVLCLACYECGRFQLFKRPEGKSPAQYSRIPGFTCARHSGPETSVGDARRVNVAFGATTAEGTMEWVETNATT